MDFVSAYYYIFLAICVTAYYLIPLHFRWYVLLIGSFSYFWLATKSRRGLALLVCVIAMSYLLGIMIEKIDKDEGRNRGRLMALIVSTVLILIPLIVSKFDGLIYTVEELLALDHTGILAPLGLSFFTMQIIAYLADIYRGKISAQHNILKYALFVSFFPQIIQGPIPRYDQLEPQLTTGHKFNEESFTKGFMLIIWGFFLKLMIADRAGVVVDTIFSNPDLYRGYYVLVGGILYSIQLYTDFLACVTLAQGASLLFDIHLIDNFNHPYFSTSIREFWGRWHISLSSWLKDYVYIPLGGNRKGRIRKYMNLCITFAVSGIWHGTGLKYIVWGLMHAGYQIVGDLTYEIRDRFFCSIRIPKNSRKRTWIQRFTTFMLVMLGWIVFRADTLMDGIFMLRSLLMTYNPWILFDDSLLQLGLDWKEWCILFVSIVLLILVSMRQERYCIRDRILAQPFYLRCLLYAAAIVIIMIFGQYGYGFDASDFIYGNF